MNLNQLFIRKKSVVNKNILVDSIECELIYLKSLLGSSPEKIFSTFKEDSLVACIKVNENIF